VVSFVAGYVMLRRSLNRGDLLISRPQLSDLLVWVAAGVIVGGRLGWWLVYHRSEGTDTPWYEVFAIWRGGMSFHGGVVGVAAAMAVWCWRSKTPFWNVADAVSLVAPIGLFLGRIANFVNAELVGRPTDLPWAIVFPGETMARHPSQVYESFLEGPLLLLLLTLLRRQRTQRDGSLSAAFVVGYGVLRFIVEFTREPDGQLGFIAFGWMTMGQLLSVAIVVAGVLI
jgi:phosphatidylglycerol:prolipoprotein diacylglycerol transferase